MDSDEPRLALEALTRAQRLAPRSTALLHQVVSAAIAAGRGEAHVALLEVMCERDPLNPVPHLTRGLILDRLGSLDLAIDALETAMALAPGAREPIRLLAGVLSRSTRASQAEAAVRQALERDPTNPRLMNDHAAMLMRLHRHAEARDLLRQVLHRQGPLAPVVCNLANATVCLGLQDEAVELAQCAIALDGEALLPRRALANTLPYQDGVTGAALLRAARDCSRVLPRGSLPVLRRGDPGRALTIGLLSGTLRTHPVGWLTIAGFEHLDPSAFQIVCLSRAPEPADPIARRFHAVARSWENVAPLSDEALARRARELGIDIVIDLGGHGDAARMPACARRLAPVQVKPLDGFAGDGLVPHRPLGNPARAGDAVFRADVAHAGWLRVLQSTALRARRCRVAGSSKQIRDLRLLQQHRQDHAAGDRDLELDFASGAGFAVDSEDTSIERRPDGGSIAARVRSVRD
jgi:predicted O-linked N-acetylglucosamine transferase (SPINDLY family)